MSKVILDEVLKYEQPTKYIVESVAYDDDFEVPVLTAGKSFILGYTNETKNIFNDLPIIIFDDFTTSIQFVDFPFKVKSSAMKILKPVKEKADIRYLFYLMQTIKFEAGEHKRYWISKYSQLEVILPPLPIQKAIAEKLDKADALRKKDKELLKYYDELAQSVFIDMFGDPVKNEKGWSKINGENYSENISVGVVIKPASHYVKNGVLALRSLNIRTDYFHLKDVVYFSEIAHNTMLRKSQLKTGDVVVVRTGNTGTAAVITEELNNVNCIDLLIVRPKVNVIHPKYLSCLLNSKSGKNLTMGHQVGGIQKHLNVGSLKKISLPIPPLPLQQEFASIIQNIEQQKEMVKQQAEESENLFKALLQESFN